MVFGFSGLKHVSLSGWKVSGVWTLSIAVFFQALFTLFYERLKFHELGDYEAKSFK